MAVIALVPATLVWAGDFYSDQSEILVERNGKIVQRLPAERIRLDYPDAPFRAEANAATDSNGTIWVVVSLGSSGKGFKGADRLFRSDDGGKTWSSRRLVNLRPVSAFTVLKNDTLLLATLRTRGEQNLALLIHKSKDQGKTWQRISTIPAEPFDNIGEGKIAFTQLKDGTILLPVGRWNTNRTEKINLRHHYVFRSTDGGKSWAADGGDPNLKRVGQGPASYWPGLGGTFPGCGETQIIQLVNGKLLAALRFSGPPQPWHKQKIDPWGGSHKTDSVGRHFKHVFLGDSFDDGRSWKNLRPAWDAKGQGLLIFGEAHGQLVQVSDGRVVLVNDRRYPCELGETRARVSRDDGQTWDQEIYHLCGGHGYPASVVRPDGTIVTITGSSLLGACPGRDLRYAKLLEKPQVWVIRWKPPTRHR